MHVDIHELVYGTLCAIQLVGKLDNPSDTSVTFIVLHLKDIWCFSPDFSICQFSQHRCTCMPIFNSHWEIKIQMPVQWDLFRIVLPHNLSPWISQSICHSSFNVQIWKCQWFSWCFKADWSLLDLPGRPVWATLLWKKFRDWRYL